MADAGVIAALAVLSVILILLNGWCIYIIVQSTPLRLPSTFAIGSLLCCHLLQGTVVIPSYIVKRLKIPNPSISGPACDIFRVSYMITNYVSCLTLLLISIDRMCAIARPLRYKTFITNIKIIIAIIVVWVYVIVLCMLPFIPPAGGSSSRCKYLPQKEWTIAMLSFNTLLPFILLIICYTAIFKMARHARHQRVKLSSYVPRISRMNDAAAELNIAKISAAVVLAYAFCWGPSFVYYFLASVCPDCFSKSYNDSKSEEILTFLMKFLTFIDGIIAPVIYCLKHKGFRHRIPFIRRRSVWPISDMPDTIRVQTISRSQRSPVLK